MKKGEPALICKNARKVIEHQGKNPIQRPLLLENGENISEERLLGLLPIKQFSTLDQVKAFSQYFSQNRQLFQKLRNLLISLRSRKKNSIDLDMQCWVMMHITSYLRKKGKEYQDPLLEHLASLLIELKSSRYPITLQGKVVDLSEFYQHYYESLNQWKRQQQKKQQRKKQQRKKIMNKFKDILSQATQSFKSFFENPYQDNENDQISQTRSEKDKLLFKLD